MTTSMLADQPGAVSVDAKLASLLEEAAQKLQRGESVDLAGLAVDHPSHADALRDLLPTIAVMVGITRKSSDKSAGLSGMLGKYQLMAKLGEGGMGAVYMAMHTELQKTVALKVLPSNRMNDANAVARFRREIKAAGRFDHANIVRASDAGEERGTHFLVMEYIDGCDLSRLVRRLGPLPVADACQIIRLAAEGLEFAHGHGIVHRDVKPSNIMLTPQGQIKILDLGLALLDDRHRAEQGELTNSGQMIGTIDYMAPEQGSDSHAVDARVDVYSLGATLYQLLSGNAPFAGAEFDTLLKKMNAVASVPAAPIDELRPDVPKPLATMIARMLAKTPAERFRSAADVALALVPYASGCNLPALLRQSSAAPQQRAADTWALSTSNRFHSGTNSNVAADSPAPKSATSPYGPRARRWNWPLVAAAFFGAIVAAGVILIVRDKDGKEKFRVAVDKNDKIEVAEEHAPSPPTTPAEGAAAPKSSQAEVRPFLGNLPEEFIVHEWAVYLGCGVTGSPGGVYQVRMNGEVPGCIPLVDPPNGLALRDGSLVIANATPTVGGGQMLIVGPGGKLDRLALKKEFPAPIALALDRNSKDLLVADNEQHAVSRVVEPGNEVEQLFAAPLDSDHDHFPSMSISAAADGHILFSASDPKGVYWLSPNERKLPDPILKEYATVICQPGTNRWVAMANDRLHVFEGADHRAELAPPPGTMFWHYRVMAFGPDGQLFVVLKTVGGLTIQCVNLDNNKFAGLFLWEGEQIKAMAVGPAMDWKDSSKASNTEELKIVDPEFGEPSR